MDLFDLLEQNKPKAYYDDKEIESSGLERCEYIRINSYVGSRINTDFRIKNKTIKTPEIEDKKVEIVENKTVEVIEDKVIVTENIEINETKEVVEESEQRLLIIDGSSLLSTSYFARLPRQMLFAKTQEEKELYFDKILQTKDGIYTNGVYGFMQVMIGMLQKQKPTHIAVCLDSTRMTFRKLIYDDYKGTRKPIDKPLKEQYALLREILEAIGVKVFISEASEDYANVFEADDFAGTLAKKFQGDIPVALYTKDEDYLQLVDYNTTVWMNTSKYSDMAKECEMDLNTLNLPNNTFVYTIDSLKKLKKLAPLQIIDYKAISGDSSDNIPGIKGLGDTTSIPLLQKYSSLEEIYEAIDGLDDKGLKVVAAQWKEELGVRNPMKKLVAEKENAFMSKKLATIKTDIPMEISLDDLKVNIDKTKLQEQLDKYEMKSIKL